METECKNVFKTDQNAELQGKIYRKLKNMNNFCLKTGNNLNLGRCTLFVDTNLFEKNSITKISDFHENLTQFQVKICKT